MAQTLDYIELAKQLFWNGWSAGDVFDKLNETHIRQHDAEISDKAVDDIFQKLLKDGYAFLPGLNEYVRGARADGTKLPEFKVDRDAMDQWIEEQGAAEDRRAVEENEPLLMRKLAPSFVQGALKDARTGREPGGLKEFGRLASDAVTNLVQPLTAPVGNLLATIDPTHTYAFKDPGDPEGLFRDPGLAASAALAAVQPETAPLALARLAMATGRAGAAMKAVKAAKALKGTELAGDAAKLNRLARFAMQSGTDAAGTYLGSRVNDQTYNYSGLESGLSGLFGTGIGYMLRPGADVAGRAAEATGKAVDRAVAGKEAVDVGLQGVPAVYKMNRAPARPVGQTDEFIRYALNELGLKPEDLPSGWLNDRATRGTAAQLENTIISSPVGEKFAQRWANANEILGARLKAILNDPNAYELLERLRREWPQIKQNALGDHFNLSNAFEKHPEIADALRAADEARMAELRGRFDVETPEGAAALDEALKGVAQPSNTMAYLDARISELEKNMRLAGGVDALDAPDITELKILKQLRERLGNDGGSPLQRLEGLDRLRKKIHTNLEKNKEAKLTPEQSRIFGRVKAEILKDQEAILSNSDWFGDVANDAAALWHEKRVKAAKFLDAEDKNALGQFLNPATPNEKQFWNALTSSRAFNERLKEALTQGGEEGQALLHDLQNLALDGALAEERKTGVPWTSARNRYARSDIREALNTLVGADDPRLQEIDKILELGSRMGGAGEAGSAFGRNANMSWRKLARLKRQYSTARKMAEADQGIGPKSLWADMDEYLRLAEGEGLPTGEQVAPYVPKTPSNLAPDMSPMRRAMNGLAENPVVKTTAKTTASATARQAARPGPFLQPDDSEPPEELTELEKRLWRETGWRPRPDVGGFAVN